MTYQISNMVFNYLPLITDFEDAITSYYRVISDSRPSKCEDGMFLLYNNKGRLY